ncbi:MAG: flagellar hook-length control protein FliK [Haliea sp.]
MIPQLAMLAPTPAPAPARVGQAAGATPNTDEAPPVLLFGDLLGALAGATGTVTPEQQVADTAAGFLTLPGDGLPAATVETADADADANANANANANDTAAAATVGGLWVLLAEAGLADTATAANGKPAANAQAPIPAPVSVPLEPRLPLPSVVAPTAADAALVTTAAADAPELLQGLVATGGQPALAETAAGNALTGALQAPAGEKLEAVPARPAVALPLPAPEARATFTQTLDQVVWMTREGVHQARLQLEPAHLGRVDIWLDLDGGEAKLHLGAQQAQVREALEAVLPRLRDALAQHGMSLTDASVSDSGRQQPENPDNRESTAATATAGTEADVVEGGESRSSTLSPRGLLDLYA